MPMTTIDSCRTMPSHVDVSFPFNATMATAAIHPGSASSMSSIPSPYPPFPFQTQLICRMDKDNSNSKEKSSLSSSDFHPGLFPPPSSALFQSFLRPGFPMLPFPPSSSSASSGRTSPGDDPLSRESLAERIERERKQDEEREAQQQQQHQQLQQNNPSPQAEGIRHTSFMVKDILSNRTPIHKPIPKHPASCTTCNCIRQSKRHDNSCNSPCTSPIAAGNNSVDCFLKFGVSSLLSPEECSFPHQGNYDS